MSTVIAPRPILKWAGGKQGLAKQLVGLFPDGFRTYYEPFFGGGSVLFTLRPSRAVVGDLNHWLLDTYRAVRDDPGGVARQLDGMANTKAEYERIRAIAPEGRGLVERAAQFIYLNKTCFRGLFRVNKKGRFNVPYGAYDRRYYDPANLEAVAGCLQGVEIRATDFESCLADVQADDFVYLDPPYFKQGGYSDFDRYTPGKFREPDHARLAALCRKLDASGVRWALSNSDTPHVRELFDGFRLTTLTNRRDINLDARSRTISELLITNYA